MYAMLSLEGKQLGNYDVIKRICVGGMGAVYEGRQRTAFDRRVAIKVILGNHAHDRAIQRRFAQEAQAIASLQHPHILPLIEFGESKGILYLVMPFIDGGTLTSYMRRNLPGLEDVSSIYQQLLDAVEYAHDKGLVHRDIKSSNILLEVRRNLPPHLYLADFGLVRPIRRHDTAQIGRLIPLDQVPGTPHYMAPEQTQGIVTPLTDIYALGVLLYQMLTGSLPYNDLDDVHIIQMHLHAPIPRPSAVDASIPQELDAVVRTTMAKHPQDRYSTITELRAAFLAAMCGSFGDHEALRTPRRPLASALSPPLLVHRPRHVSSSRVLDRKLPKPSIIQYRSLNESMQLTLRETSQRREKPRTIDHATNKVQMIARSRLRQSHRRRLRLPTFLFMLTLVLLMVVLITSQELDMSIVASPIATISVTMQTKTERNSYLLTASTQQMTPDFATRTLPARMILDTLIDSKTVSTSGITTVSGSQAQGILQFTNHSNKDMTVATSEIFTTATGVHVNLTQNTQVPGGQEGRDGQVNALAIVANAGTMGNIQAHAISGLCCNARELTVSNPDPFTGGTNPQTIHYVAKADLDGVKASLQSELAQHMIQQLQKQLTANEVMAGTPSYQEEIEPSIPVNGQAKHVKVTMKLRGNITVYNRATSEHLAAQLLSQRATKELGNVYQQQGPISIVGDEMYNRGNTGLIYLNITVDGVWTYALNSAQTKRWLQSIKGSTTTAAKAYLYRQPGITSVDIHLPFTTDHLPTSVDHLKIVVPTAHG